MHGLIFKRSSSKHTSYYQELIISKNAKNGKFPSENLLSCFVNRETLQ